MDEWMNGMGCVMVPLLVLLPMGLGWGRRTDGLGLP